jgi:mannose-6-phosphate isomerase-like protein (cupin superfamily)
MTKAINLREKLDQLTELWSPRIIARLNGQDVRLARLRGDFVWHDHQDSDEAFLVLQGELTVHLRDGDVVVREGELYVVPRGVEHKTSAAAECHLLIIEAAGTVNTGAVGGDRTAPTDVWL